MQGCVFFKHIIWRGYNSQRHHLLSLWKIRKKKKTPTVTMLFTLPWPGFEPGLLRPQRRVLTTRRSRLLKVVETNCVFNVKGIVMYNSLDAKYTVSLDTCKRIFYVIVKSKTNYVNLFHGWSGDAGNKVRSLKPHM